MAHPSAVITPAPLRRAIAAILRGGPLSDHDRSVVMRLALDGRTSLRLIVGLGASTIDATTVDRLCALLRSVGAEVTYESLVWSLDYSLSTTDRNGHIADRRCVTERAAKVHGADDARELIARSMEALTRLGLQAHEEVVRARVAMLHLLGATVEHMPNFEAAIRAWVR